MEETRCATTQVATMATTAMATTQVATTTQTAWADECSEMAYWTFTITMRDKAITYPSPKTKEEPFGREMRGFSREDFDRICENAKKFGVKCVRYDLRLLLLEPSEQQQAEDAELLVLEGGAYENPVSSLVQTPNADDAMFDDLLCTQFNEQAYMYGQLRQRHAQQSVVFADFEQKEDIAAGKSLVHNFDQIKHLVELRETISKLAGREELTSFVAETNRYRNRSDDGNLAGVSHHGDTESNLVCAIRLGAPLALSYNWWKKNEPVGKRLEIQLPGGSIYFMSAKAVGHDYKKSSIYTLRHAAGGPKYAVPTAELLRRRRLKRGEETNQQRNTKRKIKD